MINTTPLRKKLLDLAFSGKLVPKTGEWKTVKIDERLIDRYYLFYYLLSQRETFRSLGGGGAQPNISKKILVGYQIPLPPLAEQRAIVSRLEELLALEKSLAEDAAAIDDLLAAAKRKILDLAVAGKLVKKRGEWKMVKGL